MLFLPFRPSHSKQKLPHSHKQSDYGGTSRANDSKTAIELQRDDLVANMANKKTGQEPVTLSNLLLQDQTFRSLKKLIENINQLENNNKGI